MLIPNKIKIGAHTYAVVLTDDDRILEEATACMREQDATIWVDKRMPQTIQESSLIHEIFHALNSTLDEDTLGHSLMDSLSEQFYQVLKENNLLK